MGRLLTVEYEGNPCYQIHIEHEFHLLPGLLQKLGYDHRRRVCIVTDSNVAPLYLDKLQECLSKIFDRCSSCVIPAGEEHKNTDTVGHVYEHLIQHAFDRKDLLVALGGGVVGDLTGFTAATYLRGIDFIQVPTTLLSQVDSSIGGKTGVDFMQYKNMVGAFYMPKLVYMNLSVLQTLPADQYFSGMGEILKHGQIKDALYFRQVTENHEAIAQRNPKALEEMIYKSCVIKRDVVQRDPKEQGERVLLNFGHTIGHAIEKLSGFTLLHGQCVALGMLGAAFLSYRYGTYPKEQLERLTAAISNFQLPICLQRTAFSPEEVLNATKHDKKMEAGKVKFILLSDVGEAYITKELEDSQILEGVRYLFP